MFYDRKYFSRLHSNINKLLFGTFLNVFAKKLTKMAGIFIQKLWNRVTFFHKGRSDNNVKFGTTTKFTKQKCKKGYKIVIIWQEKLINPREIYLWKKMKNTEFKIVSIVKTDSYLHNLLSFWLSYITLIIICISLIYI